jgi:Na+-transporting NADH:ubiquinone oxidoreductase subunit F
MNTAMRDYSIVGPERQSAFHRGLVDASWYTTPIEREKLRLLMERRNGPAIRDTLLWFALLGVSGYLAHRSWGTWWMLPTFFVYGTLYGSVSDSRWHECGHRTAFETAWMNDAVYFVASFMVWREAVSWRWSHIRHHSDTIIVGRDPEIAFQRPLNARAPLKEFLGLTSNPGETKKILLNVIGRFTADELDYLPEAEHQKVIRTARIYVVVWLAVVGLCVALRSVEPLMFVVLPSFYGKWLLVAYGITQHAGLAEDTVDHRLNSRSIRMNRLHRYLYWNMNFHTEHHMFPSVPFHALPALSEATRADFPPQYSGFGAAYREIWSVYQRQKSEPNYFADRSSFLPPSDNSVRPPILSNYLPANVDSKVSVDGWIQAANSLDLVNDDVIRFDHDDETFAIYRLDDGRVRATDGLCTHAKVHLCDGAVRGGQIECPKHHGCFDVETGKAMSRPVTVDLRVHETREVDGRIEIRPSSLGV